MEIEIEYPLGYAISGGYSTPQSYRYTGYSLLNRLKLYL